MKRKNLLLICAFSCLLAFAKDPVTEMQVRLTYGSNPRLALQMTDTLEAQQGEPAYICDLLRAKIYTQSNLLEHDSAIAICLALLEHDSLIQNTRASADLRRETLSVLCNAYRAKYESEPWLRYSTELAELNRRWGYEVEALRAEAEIGYMLTHLGRTEEGLNKLDNAIQQLDVTGSVDHLDACIVVMKRKMNVLKELGRDEEIIPIGHHILAKLDHFEKHSSDYVDDSARLPNEEGVWASYAAFARAQTYAFIANAFAATGSLQSARTYLNLFRQTEYSHSYGGRKIILPASIALGEYAQAQEMYDEMESRLADDTVSNDYAEILYGRMLIAKGLNRVDEERNYWQRYTHLTQLLNQRLHESQAHDYAARYHAQEQEQTLRQIAAANTRKNILIGVLVIILIALLVVLIYFYKERGKKPREDSVQINPQPEAVSPCKVVKERPMKDLKGEQLFERLTQEIREKELFLDPNFDRQTLTGKYQLKNAQVGAAFAQSGQFASLSDFVRNCRLEHARKLLASTDLPIGEVATQSGYSRQTTFNHDFKTYFGFSPTDYRKKK